MSGYRADLPQLKPDLFVSDGGMETTLIFHEGVDLPHFASFVLLDSEEGRARLRAYYERYLAIARRHGRGLMLDSPTWRANPDWGAKLGYDAAGLKRINEASIALLDELRQAWETAQTPIVVAGVIGPRGDGYAEGRMSATEAEDYHAPQIASFAQTAADMVAAYTLNYVEEAIGIARAARALAMPCSISFTVETDGKLVGGRSLRDAVETVDRETDAAPAYYMINCAHPTHFEQALSADAPWMNRLLGVKANASTKSHAELDESETLDSGDPSDLGRRYRKLRETYPGLRILGGCCGTDDRHVAAICEACA
ncbi:homocysteine S-methyltransferase family protein [Methylocystis sp. L43]|jgi:homocysteine S-methyltransferase|uniref:homocysteine S-methyltransferase family protein n=1 Tax=unclassified Methylocystis TaxID=2625913 RepID=UPI0018C293D1|nr:MULTISPECIES: homocysteine S-methyltransferase family protein [unclassified Methylocystis]MBG0797614.1 homocysteine S-methyltransferase family protein [Methylocystis sp. L43]MBG0805220.1 homocysteine S-methyltransferase family protein [Methylocystis sp. H15]